MPAFQVKDHSLICKHDYETLHIQAWGKNSLRIRVASQRPLDVTTLHALLPRDDRAEIRIEDEKAKICNGELCCIIDKEGRLSFINSKTGKEYLAEGVPQFQMQSRSFLPLQGQLHRIDTWFKAYDDEKLYGLGQHQHGFLDQKGCIIELLQRNTQVSIPFMVSNRGYGFLWNNPAIGRVELGRNITHWHAEASKQMDYWITAAPSCRDILTQYTEVTGRAPAFPQWASGFWQSKLRYRNQEELLAVAREYKKRDLPLSVIVIDFFHWTLQGDWMFDPEQWPDPKSMVKELDDMGVKVMVSVWPSLNSRSENYATMQENGWLIRTRRGLPTHNRFIDTEPVGAVDVHFYDATHPQARRFLWEQVKKNYYDHGIRVFWLDACEPEILPVHPDHVDFYGGNGPEVLNLYPGEHVRAFYEGMKAVGETEMLMLCRSAWAGSQRYAAAVWSGDIDSTFDDLRRQVPAGLNMGLSGIPWWTTDIGGFKNGYPQTEAFRELVVRWFQYGVFRPLFRLHGVRQPEGKMCGSENEVWSFGNQAYEIIKEQLFLRERLRPYVMQQMAIAHEKGWPAIRPLFFNFDDKECADIEDQFCLGEDILVAPVTELGQTTKNVYLPQGCEWQHAFNGKRLQGGQWTRAEFDLKSIPVFVRKGSDAETLFYPPDSD